VITFQGTNTHEQFLRLEIMMKMFITFLGYNVYKMMVPDETL